MHKKKPKKRQLLILQALSDLGGEATIKQIAEKAGLNTNGVSQSLGVLDHYIICLGGKGGETRWMLISKI